MCFTALKEEIKWTFTLPMTWLQGVLINLVLAGFYRLFWTLEANPKYDTVLLYTVYFATFIMADITTTNVFGADFSRTIQKINDGESFSAILLRKNVVQFLVIILPVLLVTYGWTEYLYMDAQLLRTIPGILYPMLLFLGIGNLISVLFVVPAVSLTWHWKNLYDLRAQVPVLVSYALPFVIYGLWVYTDLPGFLNQVLRSLGTDVMVPPVESGLALLLGGFMIYTVLTGLAIFAFNHGGLRVRGRLVTRAENS